MARHEMAQSMAGECTVNLIKGVPFCSQIARIKNDTSFTGKAMSGYIEYKREFMKGWTRKVARAAGVAEGRGRRGVLLLEKLLQQLYPDALPHELPSNRTKWMRWKAGQQTPSLDSFQKIHVRARGLGYIGQGATLRALQERAGMMSEAEWEFWCHHDADPFGVADQEWGDQELEQELREQLVVLEQEAAAIRARLDRLRKSARIDA